MGPKGRFHIDYSDEAVRGALVLDKGTLTWPAPPIAAKSAPAAANSAVTKVVAAPLSPAKANFNDSLSSSLRLTLIFGALVALGGGGGGLAATVTAFCLACIAGAQVGL